MKDAFTNNLDFIFLFYGAAFFFLGAACLVLHFRERRQGASALPWIWLSCFGFVHGANEWLDMVSLSLMKPHFLQVSRVVILSISFLCVLEFFRRSIRNLRNIKIGCWIYVLLIAFVVAEFLNSGCFACLNSAARYVLGLTGVMGVSYIFWIYSRQKWVRYSSSYLFTGIAIIFFLYAISTGLIVAKSHLWLARFLNQEFFFEWAGIPIQFFRGLFSTVIAFLLIYYATKTLLFKPGVEKGALYIRLILFSFLFLYSIFLYSGFHIVSKVERHERESVRKVILSNARNLSDALGTVDFEVFTPGADEALYHQYLRMHNRLRELADISDFTKSLYLVSYKEDRPLFVVGSSIQIYPSFVVPSFGRKVPFKAISDAYHSKQPTLFGLYYGFDKYKTFSVFMPLLDQQGDVSNLLGIDLDGSKILLDISKTRLYVIFIIMAFLILLIGCYAFIIVFALKSLELEVQKIDLNKALVSLRETEAELTRSEETFRGILNNSPNAIFGFDRDLRLIFWNYGAERLYGYKKEEVVNEKNPLLSKRVVEIFGIEEKVFEIEKIYSSETLMLEMIHKTKDGAANVVMTLFPVKDPQGHILFGMGLVQDISARKRLEDQVSASYAQLKSVLDAATRVSIIATDLKGIITIFNSGAENLLGYSVDEIVGKETPALFHDKREVDAFAQELSLKLGRPLKGFGAILENVREGNFLEREWIHVRKDGTTFPIEVAITGIRNDKDEIVGFLGIGLDLSRRKAAEKALYDTQQKYKDLVNNLNVGVFITTPGPEGRFLEVNPAVLKIVEAESEDGLLDIAVSDLYVEKGKRKEISDKILKEGYIKNEEIKIMTLRGKPIWIALTSVLKKDEKGESYFYGIVQDITERKRFEQSLFEERDRLRMIATSIGAGLSLVDKDFKIVWVNETLEKWFGSLDTIQGKECFRTYQFKHVVCEGCPTKRAFDTGSMQTGETTVTFPDGRNMTFLLICSPVKNEKGEVEQVLELTLDMTERKRMVDLLEYERALSKNVIDSISDTLMVLDCKNKVIIDVNRKFLEFNGLKKEDVIGKRCNQLGIHFCPPCEACEFPEVVQKGRTIESTHVHVDHSGKRIYCDVTLVPLKDDRGRIMGVIHLSKDVSERKQLEDDLRRHSENLETLIKERTRALQASELMFRRLFESAQDGILIIDAESGKIIDANPYFLRLLECSREQIQHIDYRQVPYIVDLKVFQESFEELKSKISVFRDDVSLRTCTNRDVAIELRASMYYVENKKIIQCNIRDITERKRLDEIKTEFVSMVSHELRTPLSAIKEGVEIVSDGTQGKLNRSQKECLDIALSNIKRLNRLIGDILDISKIQSNLLKVHVSPCDIYEAVDQVYDLVKIEIEKHELVLVTDLEKDLPLGLADRDRLIQVLMNLLNNAIKFTREKSKITLTARRRNGYIEFAVRDEGAGIPPEELSRLFGKFVQLDSTLVRRVGGTGLGLYISRNLVEAMGGQIWADSKIGEGSVFSFTIAAKKEGGA